MADLAGGLTGPAAAHGRGATPRPRPCGDSPGRHRRHRSVPTPTPSWPAWIPDRGGRIDPPPDRKRRSQPEATAILPVGMILSDETTRVGTRRARRWRPEKRRIPMEINEMVMVSVDDHVVEPPNLFEGRLPAKYADLAPKFVTNDDGTNAWLYEGNILPNVALNAVAGRPREEYGLEPTSFDQLRPGLLRHRRAGEGHGRQRGAGLVVLPLLPPVLRPDLRPDRGQGRGAGHGPGLQRLAHRRVVRDPPGPLHPLPHPGHLGSRGAGGRGPTHRGQGRPRRHLLGEPLQAGLAQRPLRPLGPVLEGVQRRGRWWCACTSARRRRS